MVAALQAVAGVIACELTLLCRPPLQAGLADQLAAAVPLPGLADPPPAEILLLDPRPIHFTVLP